MNQEFFRVPFATEGDKQEIEVPVDPTGAVSFTKGYGPDYERDQTTDPLAKPIEREGMNWLFGAITEALRQYQTFGVPEFITEVDNGGTAFPYEAGAQVKYRADDLDPWLVYESLVNNNTQLPGAGAQWRLRGALATAAAPGQIQIATTAEAQALTNDANALTPKKLADAFKGPNQQLGVNGYQFLPGGVLDQWGVLDGATGNFSVTFPLSYPTRGYPFICTAEETHNEYIIPQIIAKTVNGFSGVIYSGLPGSPPVVNSKPVRLVWGSKGH